MGMWGSPKALWPTAVVFLLPSMGKSWGLGGSWQTDVESCILPLLAYVYIINIESKIMT